MATVTDKTITGNKRLLQVVQSALALPADVVEVLDLPIGFPHCFACAQFFDAVGNFVTPSAGSLVVLVQTVVNAPNFEAVPNNTVDATAPATVSWAANTSAVRVTPTGLAGVTNWRLFLTFNRT